METSSGETAVVAHKTGNLVSFFRKFPLVSLGLVAASEQTELDKPNKGFVFAGVGVGVGVLRCGNIEFDCSEGKAVELNEEEKSGRFRSLNVGVGVGEITNIDGTDPLDF